MTCVTLSMWTRLWHACAKTSPTFAGQSPPGHSNTWGRLPPGFGRARTRSPCLRGFRSTLQARARGWLRSRARWPTARFWTSPRAGTCTRSRFRQVRPGPERAGRHPDAVEITSVVTCCVEDDRAAVLQHARAGFIERLSGCGVQVPRAQPPEVRPELERLRLMIHAGESERASQELSDELVTPLIGAGRPGELPMALQRHFDACRTRRRPVPFREHGPSSTILSMRERQHNQAREGAVVLVFLHLILIRRQPVRWIDGAAHLSTAVPWNLPRPARGMMAGTDWKPELASGHQASPRVR